MLKVRETLIVNLALIAVVMALVASGNAHQVAGLVSKPGALPWLSADSGDGSGFKIAPVRCPSGNC